MEYEDEQYTEGSERSLRRIILVLSAAALVVLAIFFILRLVTPPGDFPVDRMVTIEEGSTVRDTADTLKDQGVVRSSLLLYTILETQFADRFIRAGNYTFTEPKSAFDVARAVTSGAGSLPPVILTFPEGLRGETMAPIITAELPHLDTPNLPDRLDEHIGYLFPETYHISKTFSLSELIQLMRDTYSDKTEPLRPQFASSTLSENEIIILASIVEREANDRESMTLVAGVLMNRLTADMPLQVDATLEYLNGKASAELTEEDLEIDSPYNTYRYKGLPPTPIANPGLDAIRAVLNPEDTEYYFYLTGVDGNFYYAKTHDEHVENKRQYLN